jgi:DNA-binding MarR family transcriptional regulator
MEFIQLFNELYNKFMERYVGSDSYKNYFSNMSYKEVSYLSEIHIHKGISSVDLARKMGVTKSAVSQIISKMCCKGYVEKKKSNDDGRESKLFLTERIEKVYEENDKILSRIFDESLSSISEEEKKVLCSLLVKINKNL